MRAKGFITKWAPQGKTKVLIGQIREIVSTWESEGVTPVKNRTVYYKLGTKYGHPKNDSFGDTVNTLLTKMRRCDRDALPDYWLDWRLIIDEGATPPVGDWYSNPRHFWQQMEFMADDYGIDRLSGQDRRFVVWMEAGGLMAAARHAADKYSVPVATCGKQDSYYIKRKAAEWIVECGVPVTIFHIGDLDGQGINIYETLRSDLPAMVDFLGGDVEVIRLGVLPEQIEQYGLGTRPAKGTKEDRRHGITTACEAEAFDPVDIAALVENAITSRIDMDLYRETVGREAQERGAIVEHMGSAL